MKKNKISFCVIIWHFEPASAKPIKHATYIYVSRRQSYRNDNERRVRDATR